VAFLHANLKPSPPFLSPPLHLSQGAKYHTSLSSCSLAYSTNRLFFNPLGLNSMSLSRAHPRILTSRWSRVYRRGFAGTARRSAEEVRIVEVGPRDGLQNEKNTIPLSTKIELIRRLAGTGIRTMEAGSFVAPNWVPQVSHLQVSGLSPPLLYRSRRIPI